MASYDSPQEKYDVFLSFRGDTRYNFTSHLYGALIRANISTFIDKDLKRGKKIWSSLLNVIRESKISVIIFSKRYGSSKWCLKELREIISGQKKKNGQIVIPVFYLVDPSDVRNQTGTFGVGFAKHDNRSETLRREWRDALTAAANLSGWHLDGKKPEYDRIQEIVEDVRRTLIHMYPRIWGMGGIGKTTIAKAVSNKIFKEFDDYFFADVNTSLQKDLFSAILQDEKADLACELTKIRLGCKKVLIVFDNVESKKQITDLIGDLNCFGLGSRFIITTRNKQVLKNCGVDDTNIYKVERLFHHEASQLFSWHAFQQKYPPSGYYELSKRVIKYANGVPLALAVLGSILFGKKEEVWESVINKLQIMPWKDIQDVLKVSYDRLDPKQQGIFLDIACFFERESKALVIKFCDIDNSGPTCEIDALIDKCLISVSSDKIIMHDLLREMGKGIIQEFSQYPEDWSRLWHPKDIYPILEESTGTRAIEGIWFDMIEGSKIELNPHVFREMKRLRFLKIYNSYCEKDNISKIDVSQGLESPFTKLRYFCWHGCPVNPSQLKFNPQNLVVLDMPYTNVEQLWTDTQDLKNLKSINLSYSKNLLKIPDLSLARNLESLILEGCTKLSEICSSIRYLNNLVILNLKCCKSLSSLPMGIHSQSLRKVILSYCSNLRTFPDVSWSIQELFLDRTAIEKLPSSIENLSRLVKLNLEECSRLENLPSNIYELKSLQHLNLSGCSKLDGFPELRNLEDLKVLSSNLCVRILMELNLTDCCIRELPNSLGQLLCLKRLLLGRNKFERIPTSIIHLSKLSYLELGYCERLQSLPELPCQLRYIDAHNCTTLEATSSLSIPYRSYLGNVRVNFISCSKLDQNALGDFMNDPLLKIPRFEVYKEFYPRPSASICFPGTKIPEWFSTRSSGSSINLELPSNWLNPSFVNFAMCAVVEFRNYHNEGQGLVVGCECKFKTNDEIVLYHGTLKGWHYNSGPENVNSDHIFMGYDFHMCPSGYYDKITIQFYAEDLNNKRIACCNVKECGIHLLYTEINEEEEEPFPKRLKISRNNIYSRKRKRNQIPKD
ncbi:disease resistance protein RPP2B-like [Pistacia vera]|uniref:disease resistance protein RPP2B-like n=1 Tax=Pistacia vera TaxID=55513 RepID=UPI0012636E1B|nr:disease resistance protein RPP2B-like [Pistacia vera]